MNRFLAPLIGISLVSLTLLLSSCPVFGGQPASDEEGLDLSQTELPEKGNPNLDSQLNQLVRAEMRGEAASFAQQSNIELVDGNVRVIIECVPGQLDAATEAAIALGASVETSYGNLLQVVVPIASLTTLADSPSIHFIRLPQYPLPGATNGDGGLINRTEWQI